MFLDTVNIDEINNYLNTGVLKGVTSNPTLLLKEGKNRDEQIKEILAMDVDQLFVQVIGDSVETLWADYELIKELETDNKKIALKVSLNTEGFRFIQKIKEKDPERIVLGTAIYSADQAILGAIAGCEYLAPYVNRMENNNIDAFEVIEQSRQFIDSRELNSQIMGASFKNTNQVIHALNAGAHIVTVPPEILEKMMNKELAIDAIDVFNSDGQELAQKNNK